MTTTRLKGVFTSRISNVIFKVSRSQHADQELRGIPFAHSDLLTLHERKSWPLSKGFLFRTGRQGELCYARVNVRSIHLTSRFFLVVVVFRRTGTATILFIVIIFFFLFFFIGSFLATGYILFRLTIRGNLVGIDMIFGVFFI